MEIEIPTKPKKTPFLNVAVDEGIWQKIDSREGWWGLNTGSKTFSEGMPYYGILHGEVLAGDAGKKVINLAIDLGDGEHGIFSFGFDENGEKEVFLNSCREKKEFVKVMKIAFELLHHLPDDELKKDLTAKLELELRKEENGSKKIWERM
jgi:tRNA threonylcarbamoyladenosine modification (KEOPS) complex Cgi121 subunit